MYHDDVNQIDFIYFNPLELRLGLAPIDAFLLTKSLRTYHPPDSERSKEAIRVNKYQSTLQYSSSTVSHHRIGSTLTHPAQSLVISCSLPPLTQLSLRHCSVSFDHPPPPTLQSSSLSSHVIIRLHPRPLRSMTTRSNRQGQ